MIKMRERESACQEGDERERGSGMKWQEKKARGMKLFSLSVPLWGGGTQLGSPR